MFSGICFKPILKQNLVLHKKDRCEWAAAFFPDTAGMPFADLVSWGIRLPFSKKVESCSLPAGAFVDSIPRRPIPGNPESPFPFGPGSFLTIRHWIFYAYGSPCRSVRGITVSARRYFRFIAIPGDFFLFLLQLSHRREAETGRSPPSRSLHRLIP